MELVCPCVKQYFSQTSVVDEIANDSQKLSRSRIRNMNNENLPKAFKKYFESPCICSGKNFKVTFDDFYRYIMAKFPSSPDDEESKI